MYIWTFFLLPMYTQGGDILKIWLNPNIILHTLFKSFWLVCVCFHASFMVGLTLINLWYICTLSYLYTCTSYFLYTCTLLYFIIHTHSKDELNFVFCSSTRSSTCYGLIYFVFCSSNYSPTLCCHQRDRQEVRSAISMEEYHLFVLLVL